ncbi:serine--tRNA ligase [Candidatus Daviesbacteria bacterium RIFCSPHIGHO2_02_FULL_36_13]|uniref:Serine--tRNA ligase n=1 Tax=Candidatus Daviesbacteria bacterium RIFCSPHIGHO2_02_FULL_36_13 TaxID=1797768 RepID=A0A1F5JYG7_9BACT|nr:MAG: serine--tRNA ligase [Candidatus Daviesbacteria bacterium RIFCSPHIGHO2_02_FULL_36_13]
MLDINYIRENKERVKKSIEARKAQVDLDKILELDDKRRDLIKKVDEKRAVRNAFPKEKPDQSQLEHMQKLKQEIDELEPQLKEIEEEYEKLMYQVPNILMDEVPIGDVSSNKIIKTEGEPAKFSFKVRDHIELGKMLDIIDFDRGVKVGGYRSYYLKNEGARLHWAILNFALDYVSQKGFQVVVPPIVNKGFALLGGGQFPWGEEDTYKLGDDEYLVGTAEIPLMAMHADETFNKSDLPKKYVALTPCFRTEIGSYGKDTKGLYRVHEFYKVEQVILCEADEKESLGFFEDLLDNAEGILQELGFPYQVVCVSSQDMSKKGALQYDIETWMPGRDAYGETHSNSIVFDFQTRRLKIRYKDEEGNIKHAHALNNTAIASPRILIAILENFQQEDGSVKIPEVLQKYTGFSEITPK